MGELDDVVGLLSELVRIPSINPRGRAVADDGPGEGPLAVAVVEWLAHRGITATMHEVLPGRRNVLAMVEGERPELLVLEAHLDTVEVEGMTVDPFAAAVHDGRLYGRGACDTKGSLAAYLLALVALTGGPRPPVSVALAATVDEEHHYRGVLALLDELERQGRRCVGAVVGEPTGLALATAHRGVVRGTVHVQGRAGHSSRPQEALNAIGLASRLVQQVEQVAPATAPHPLLGEATRTVTRIAAGAGPNVVPGHCEFDIDRRTLPGEDPQQVWADLRDELAALAPGHVTADQPHTIDLSLDTQQDRPLVRAVQEALLGAGLDPTPFGMPFCTDASKFPPRGVDAVVLGPGSIDDAHTEDESVDLDEVVRTVRLVVAIARSASWRERRG